MERFYDPIHLNVYKFEVTTLLALINADRKSAEEIVDVVSQPDLVAIALYNRVQMPSFEPLDVAEALKQAITQRGVFIATVGLMDPAASPDPQVLENLKVVYAAMQNAASTVYMQRPPGVDNIGVDEAADEPYTQQK